MGLSVGCLKGSSLSPIYISVSPIAIYNLQIGYFCLALFSPSCRIIATKGGSLAGQAAAKRRRTWSRNSSATVKWSDGRAYGTTCHPAAKEPGNPWWTACTPVLQAWYLHMNIWVPSKGYTFSLFMIFEQDIMSLKCVSNEIRVHQKNIDSQVSYRKRKLRINSHRVKSSSSSCNPAWPSKPRSPTITLEETSRFRVQRCPRIPELLWKENDTQKLETWSFPAKKKNKRILKVHSQKVTWNLRMMSCKSRNFLVQGCFLHCYMFVFPEVVPTLDVPSPQILASPAACLAAVSRAARSADIKM